MSAVGGKVFSDGRAIVVAQSPDWEAVSKQSDFDKPGNWQAMTEVERAVWCLEQSDEQSVQWGTYRAEWAKPETVTQDTAA